MSDIEKAAIEHATLYYLKMVSEMDFQQVSAGEHPIKKESFIKGAKWILEQAYKNAYPSEVDSDGEAAGTEKYWVKISSLEALFKESNDQAS